MAQNNRWRPFFILFSISLLLFIALQLIEFRPIAKFFKKLESKEFLHVSGFDKYGIERIFNMCDFDELADRNREIAEILARGTSFSLLGETGNSYFDPSARRHWDYLKPKLEAGFTFRLLLINPLCPSKQLRNKINDVNTHLDPKLKLDHIIMLSRRYPNLEIKFTDETYCSLFFSESDLFYDPYHLGKIADRLENYFIAVHVKNTSAIKGNKDYYAMLTNHFETLWKLAITLDEFQDRHYPQNQINSMPIHSLKQFQPAEQEI